MPWTFSLAVSALVGLVTWLMFWVFWCFVCGLFFCLFFSISECPTRAGTMSAVYNGYPPGVASCLAHSGLSGRNATGSLALIKGNRVGQHPAHLIFFPLNLWPSHHDPSQVADSDYVKSVCLVINRNNEYLHKHSDLGTLVSISLERVAC